MGDKKALDIHGAPSSVSICKTELTEKLANFRFDSKENWPIAAELNCQFFPRKREPEIETFFQRLHENEQSGMRKEGKIRDVFYLTPNFNFK